MPHANLDLIERFFAAYGSRDLTAHWVDQARLRERRVATESAMAQTRDWKGMQEWQGQQ